MNYERNKLKKEKGEQVREGNWRRTLGMKEKKKEIKEGNE